MKAERPESTISAIASLLPDDLLDPPRGVMLPAAPRFGRDQTALCDMSQVGSMAEVVEPLLQSFDRVDRRPGVW